MSFDSLLGNEQLKKELSGSIRKGNISHCYLICGPEGSGKHTLARLLAAAIHCTGQEKPCMICQPCRKVMEDTHPDVITVDDREHKTVTVRVVREARADIYVMPNESDRKIYLFPRAQDMGVEGQNALLKVLEEPPEYAVFILLSDNPEKLLPTVRSRCRELRMQPLDRNLLQRRLETDFPNAAPADIHGAIRRSGGYLGQARALLEEGSDLPPQTESFFRAFAGKDTLLLAQTLAPMEKWKRDALIPILESWLAILEEALADRSGSAAVSQLARQTAASCTGRDIYRGISCLRKATDYARSNVSPGAVCGWLLWELW